MNEVFENSVYLNCFLIQIDREKADGSDIGLNCTPELWKPKQSTQWEVSLYAQIMFILNHCPSNDLIGTFL